MKIGELAKRTGCSAETVRYYEREGLLGEPERSGGNYRLYGAEHVERLTFIRNCRALEMSLDEIRTLLRVKDQAGQDCCEVNAVLEAHMDHVAERIDQLRRLEAQLRALRDACRRITPVEDCAILKELAEQPEGDVRAGRLERLHAHAGTGRRK